MKTCTVAAVAAGGAGWLPAQEEKPERKVKLGLDNFAVREMRYKPAELIDYAASLKTDSLFISDIKSFESRETSHLQDLKKKAADLGLQIHLGTWSICPTSRTFDKQWGTAEEHLALAIRMAKDIGSPVIRVILGNGDDRKAKGGIDGHIKEMVKVCQANRSLANDAGVKIAVENHAGDLHSSELVRLIEEAGKDYVGANMDSGNAAWALEDPMDNLEALGPYALTTSLRDSAIWEFEDGAKVQWTAMGEGDTDLKAYFKRFRELCPNVPVHIETISGFARPIPYLKKEFWETWPQLKAKDFARFVALAKKGKPHQPHKNPTGKDKTETDQLSQKAELERSIKYCKEELSLGLKV